MKALLIKDMNLLKGQKQFFGALIAIMIMFTVIQNDPAFVITYITLMFSILTTTTMGYDDFENGMCYFLTLPISRRQYVTEKYIFGVLSSVCGVLGASVFTSASFLIRGINYPWDEWRAAVTVCILLIAAALSVTMPIQFKFGSEKSRMAIFGVFGAGCLGVFAIGKLCEAAGIKIEELLENALVKNLTTTFWGISIVSVIILVSSYLVSVRVLEKREF